MEESDEKTPEFFKISVVLLVGILMGIMITLVVTYPFTRRWADVDYQAKNCENRFVVVVGHNSNVEILNTYDDGNSYVKIYHDKNESDKMIKKLRDFLGE